LDQEAERQRARMEQRSCWFEKHVDRDVEEGHLNRECSPLAFIISVNLKRRHLAESQSGDDRGGVGGASRAAEVEKEALAACQSCEGWQAQGLT
jgi:hypothetical protein